VKVHLVDGTYELFRHYYALPSHVNAGGQEISATRGVVGSLLSLIDGGATHVAVATDHIVESFRNELWADYKDATGIEPELFSQFGLLEDAVRALGVPVWAMVEYEADDGLAAGAAMASADERVEQVLICTPDKDLAQCVEGQRVVQFDRRRRQLFDHDAIVEKFGVAPASIPDYLALMGDSADGFPGLPGWGAKSASTLLARYLHIEEIPASASDWDVSVRGAARLAATLRGEKEQALLFRRLATLVEDAPVSATVDDLEWAGATPDFAATCETLEDSRLAERAERLGPRSTHT